MEPFSSIKATSPELAQSLERFNKARALGLEFSKAGNKKEASKQCLIAAEILRKDGLKFFNNHAIAALKMEWGFYVSAYKYDSECNEAFDKANAIFAKIKSLDSGKKAAEGKENK